MTRTANVNYEVKWQSANVNDGEMTSTANVNHEVKWPCQQMWINWGEMTKEANGNLGHN